MKKLILLTITATAAMSAMAQGKLDLSASMLAGRALQSEVLSRSGESYNALPSPLAPGEKVAVVVMFADDEDASVLESRGYEVLSSRDNMAIVRMSANEMVQAAGLSAVKSIAIGAETRKLLYQAKQTTGVSTIHEGGSEVGGQSYDGTGVVVGLMDQGLDINHPNFLKADGTPRASRLYVITGTTGALATYDTPSKIAEYTTDDSGETHATHVLGCMAGSFGSNGEKYSKVSFINARGINQVGSNRWTSLTDYRGSATGSDIVACCGTTGGTNILLAAEKIYQYAKSQNKPAVMNISLGHNYGPHDGTDVNSKYLESIGKDMIICVSAGNEGSDPISIHKDFTASSTQVKTSPSATCSVSGIVDIWGKDNSVYNVTFQLINKSTGAVLFSYTLDKNLNSIDNEQETMVIIAGNAYNVPYYIYDNTFNSAFGQRGAVQISSNIDPNNNRYNVQMSIQGAGGNNGIVPAIIVEGKSGQSVDMFCAGNAAFYSNNLAGFTAGSPDNSINGIATAKNVIAVGAYVNANKIPTLAGLGTYRGVEPGQIADFSSYGTSFDGRVLPHVAGPGQAMLSSYSYHYTSKQPANSDVIAQATGYVTKAVKSPTSGKTENRDYYWSEMSGTSMSSPFVAGVIALWLQADPTLKYDDVMNVINETSIKDAFTAAAPTRFGAGRINALAGIKKVLNLTGIADVAVDASDFVVTPTFGRGFEIFAAGAQGIRGELYSMNGSLAASVSASGDTAVLDASAATPGIYILRSTTASGRTDSRKVVLK